MQFPRYLVPELTPSYPFPEGVCRLRRGRANAGSRHVTLSVVLPLWLVIAFFCARLPAFAASPRAAWLSPAVLAASPDGSCLFVGCATGKRVLFFDLAGQKVTRSIPLPFPATGLAVTTDGQSLYVTCAAPQSEICVIDIPHAKISARLAAGHTAMSPVLSPDGHTLFVCNCFENDIGVYDVAGKKLLCRIPVRREPVAAALTPDGKRLLVANRLPTGRADAEHVAAVVSVIDVGQRRVIDDLWLPSGSGGLNDLRISPDGKHAVVTHVLARFHLPTTQADRGWIATNAKTLIALDPLSVVNTVLLDNIDRGAANPWGVAWDATGKTLVLTHAGTHEISVIDFPGVVAKLAKTGAELPPTPSGWSGGSRSVSDIPNDLAFLVGLRERRALPTGDLGPRGVVVIGRRAYTANYFSDTLTSVELDGEHPQIRSIALGPKPVMSEQRRGELYFHDARLCFQGWQSCATCHPGEARVDGLNWDLLNDGIGNPKNTKSLLLSHRTPPAMSTGARETAETAVRAGLQHILFTVQPPEVPAAIDEYLKALQPLPSPYLVKGKLSAAARRGEKLFRSPETGCAQCHPAPLFTDLKPHDVGTRGPLDGDTCAFDTPTLIEIWRTAPYLHDGSAATLRDVLTETNPDDLHGKTSHLTADQILDLCQYLLSL